jgi:hypothetical protein
MFFLHASRPYLVIAIIITFTACSRRTPNDLYVVKSLKTGLEHSNIYIQRESETIFNSFELKRQFPETKQKVDILLPEMLKVREIVSVVIKEIEETQRDLRSETSFKNGTETVYHEDNLDVVKRLFIEQKKAASLFQIIKNHKGDLININKNNSDFISKMLIDIPLNGSGLKELDNFVEFFKNQPAIAADAFLERLKNDVLLNEKRMLSFINDRMVNDYIHWMPEPLISISSEHVKSNDELHLTAGIGAFRYFSNSYMIVNGNKMLPNEKGVFTYSFKINGKPGKYKEPVEITYTEADGNSTSITRTIEYTIIK